MPGETFLHVTDYLTPRDLAKLSVTSKRINVLVDTILWKDIELHETGYHESSKELKDPAPFTAPAARHYHDNVRYGSGQGGSMKARSLFAMLDSTRKDDPSRFQILVSRVRSLCTAVDNSTAWALFPHFSNLESLELHGVSDNYDLDVDVGLQPLKKLRFLKLFAYVPRNFARYAMVGSAATLERLELGLLDRPISTNLAYDRKNKPLPHERINQTADDDEAEDNHSD